MSRKIPGKFYHLSRVRFAADQPEFLFAPSQELIGDPELQGFRDKVAETFSR
jgi:hypothetical protein